MTNYEEARVKLTNTQLNHKLHPNWVMWEQGGMSHFSGLYRRDIDQIGILIGNCHFRWGDFFSGETPCIKHSELESQTKKRTIPIVISTISHFWPLP